jgi:hypothetical protein
MKQGQDSQELTSLHLWANRKPDSAAGDTLSRVTALQSAWLHCKLLVFCFCEIDGLTVLFSCLSSCGFVFSVCLATNASNFACLFVVKVEKKKQFETRFRREF